MATRQKANRKCDFNNNFRTSLFFLGLFFTPFILSAHTNGDIVIKDAWIREAPANAPVMAAYMEIENHTASEKVITAVMSSTFESVEIHLSKEHDGMAMMEKQDTLSIAAEGKVSLKPGGLHLMLISPKHALKAGSEVDITLQFSDGKKTNAMVKVIKKDNKEDHSHQHHQH